MEILTISDQSQKLFRITCNFGCGDLCFFMCVAEFCVLVILACNFGAAYRGVIQRRTLSSHAKPRLWRGNVVVYVYITRYGSCLLRFMLYTLSWRSFVRCGADVSFLCSMQLFALVYAILWLI